MHHPITRLPPILAVLGIACSQLQLGCASHDGSVSTPRQLAAMPVGRGGLIGLTSPSAPAAYSFEPASGRLSAADGAVNGLTFMARAAAGSGEGLLVAVALLPVAAVVGAVVNVATVVPFEERTRGESELQSTLHGMASQQRFRDEFDDVVRLRKGRSFVSLDRAAAAHARSRSEVTSILELAVTDLRLERAALTDHSYTMLIKARVRLLQTEGDTVLYDETIEFRSSAASFESWTHRRSLQEATRYGYRMIAEKVMDRILPAT